MSTPTVPEPEAPERDAVAEMRAALRKQGWTPERQEALKVAHREMRERYGRMYVLYREVWDGNRLTEPLVRAASLDEDEVLAIYEQLPLDQQRATSVRYVHPAGMAMGY